MREKHRTAAFSRLPSAHPRRVPCDLPDPSLWLTEGTVLCSSPHSLPPSQSLRCQEEKTGEWEGELGTHIKERLSQWVPVSSRPSHLARWDLDSYTHTHRQHFNGYHNGLCLFFGLYSHRFFCFFLRTCCNNLKSFRGQITGSQ